jgi:Protein of unknown function (DUF2735)
MEPTMTNDLKQSAKIYQFPAGGRAGVGGRGDVMVRAQSSVDPRLAKVAAGGAWYHDEAVCAERTAKN